MATYTSHLNLKLPDYSDTADINDLNNNFKKIDDAIASGGIGGGTGGGIVTETDPTVPSWAKQPSKPTYTAAEVGALPDTTVIPTVPSALPNPQPIVINGISYDGSERKEITVSAGDGGSITETDPTVPAWAKAENKPSYTAEEVGALPSTYKPPVTSVNGKTGAVSLVASDVGALPNTTVIPTVPTALKNPYPLTINGVSYDGSEAKTVTIESTGGGASVELDTTLTQYGKAADAGAVGNAIAQETAAREAAVNSLNEANAAQNTEIAKKANEDDLAAVAKSGSYNDLSNKPTIPTVPTALKNPNALTFTGAVNETYDGSAAKSVSIPTIPESLKNPNKLILSGAVTAEYDGSAEVSVEIPAGGGSAYELPVASPSTLGGVMPAAKTDEMTQAVGVDDAGGLWTMSGGGSGGNTGGTSEWTLINDITTEEEVTELIISTDSTGAALNEELLFFRLRCPPGTGDNATNIELRLNYRASHYNGMNCGMFKYLVNAAGNTQAKEAVAFIDGKKGAVFKTSNGSIRGYNPAMNADLEVEEGTPSMNLSFSAGGTSLKPITNIRLGGTIPAGSRVIMYSKR